MIDSWPRSHGGFRHRDNLRWPCRRARRSRWRRRDDDGTHDRNSHGCLCLAKKFLQRQALARRCRTLLVGFALLTGILIVQGALQRSLLF